MSEYVKKENVDTLVDELARAISDERCFMSKGRSTANIMQDILNLPTYSFPDSAKNKDGWIPIEERKPNEYDDVLVSTDIEEVFEATYYGDELGFDNNNGNFYEGEVIAWQPLPKSYKKGE